ncbi:MAG: zinc-binding dehydrogenase [Clostridia bacterium]|nr:zinc-binding dehydrogenase [Clostridia bacterium]
MNNKQIVFTEINKAELLEVECPEISENQVLVETHFSSISCGTEKANIMGDPNVSIYADGAVVFPRELGYSGAGVVMAKGSNVTSVDVGDSVAMRGSLHRKYNVVPEENVVKFNADKVSMQEASLCYIGTFPMAALRKTRLEVGESMMVMGLGILGLLGVQFAKVAGAVPVIAVDPVPERREKALKFGADYALDPFDKDFTKKVIELTDGGVKTAIEVTGLGTGLNQCLDCMAKFGRIALLGCTRDKNFTVDYYRKVHGPGIQLIGAHTLARPVHDSLPGYFTHTDDIKTILKLCEFGRMDLKAMVDEVHLPGDCSEVYTRLINDKNFPVVSQFDWRGIE